MGNGGEDVTGKRRRRLLAGYGEKPDVEYFAGDMEYIRAYHDLRRGREADAFFVDETTWNDLDMDGVYRRINQARSTSGEQYLYHWLRAPALEEADWAERAELVELMGREENRLPALDALSRLGRTRRADLCAAFTPQRRSRLWLPLFTLLSALVALPLLLIPVLGRAGLLIAVFAAALNNLVHEVCRRKREREYDTVNYCVGMAAAVRRIRRQKNPALDRHMAGAYGALSRLAPALRVGGVSAAAFDSLAGQLAATLLLDLISFEFLKNRLGKGYRDLFTLHEHLGRLDAAICVSSWRAGMNVWCEPELAFGGQAAFMEAEGMTHPLLEGAVPNDLSAERPVLVTGSNASGKSTFLKTAALSALLGQSLCTCPAARYRGAAMRVATSMALKDDLSGGESYYIVETRSLKRIVDLMSKPPLLTAVDEVLRGTNTVERIAASAQVLRALARGGALCLAATHDGELCALLQGEYDQYHFEEEMGQGRMLFDYRLRPGPASSRNAISLLGLMGFDGRLVEGARRMAAEYDETGAWRMPDG